MGAVGAHASDLVVGLMFAPNLLQQRSTIQVTAVKNRGVQLGSGAPPSYVWLSGAWVQVGG